jgi:hypothetical protein
MCGESHYKVIDEYTCVLRVITKVIDEPKKKIFWESHYKVIGEYTCVLRVITKWLESSVAGGNVRTRPVRTLDLSSAKW